MGIAEYQEAQGASGLKYPHHRADRKEYSTYTQPKIALKPSMSRYRRARKNVPEKPDLTLSIPKAPLLAFVEESTATPSAEEKMERARILAETQRQLEGNWWDQKSAAADTTGADWWEEKRAVTRGRDDHHNPFRDPPVAKRVEHQHPVPLESSSQPTTNPTVAQTLDQRLQSSKIQTSPVKAQMPFANSAPKPLYQRTDTLNDQHSLPTRYRQRNQPVVSRSQSQKRGGHSSSEEGMIKVTDRGDMPPKPHASSKGTGHGRIHNLVTLGRKKTVRSEPKDLHQSRPTTASSDHMKQEAFSPRKLITADRPGSGNRHKGPRTDAPISAANAGKREVLITYNDSLAQLPVIPSTKARDALQAAGGLLNESIDPRNSILLETCPHLGLERPLRMYEKLRAVMNSWDNDSQNGLSIISQPSESSMAEAEKKGAQIGLEAIDAPRKQPGNVTFQMYHCNSSEKWHKRYITLRSDGQILLSKKEHSKDTTNVCHMSDFDIYCLRRRQTNKLKPAKKYCYAIKSQQKLSMFISKDDYVHYFSTNDASVANEFYDVIQSWRSWYLVHLMGGDKRQSSGSSGLSLPTTPSDGPSPQDSPRAANTRRNPAVAHQLGSLKPLINTESMDLEPEPTNDIDLRLSDNSKLVSRAKTVHKAAPSRFKKTAAVYDDITGAFIKNRSRAATSGSASSGLPDEPFMSNGLLGKQYEERQKEMRAREAAMANNMDFPGRPSGTNEAGLSKLGRSFTQRGRGRNREEPENETGSRAQSRARSAARPNNYAQTRSRSVKAPQRTLIDFDPAVDARCPPSRRGTGDEPLPRGLISRSKTINSRSHSGGPISRGRSNTTTRSPRQPTNPFFSPQEMGMKHPFDGRVPTLPASWRDGSLHNGPRNGPLVDLSATSQFAEGSLLHRYEALSTPQGPIIDRSVEGKTIMVKTGEGF